MSPSCNFMRHSYHMALLSSLAWVLTFLNWLSINTLNSGEAVKYSRNSGGFSSKVSVSISRTMRRPSEMYFFNSRHDCIRSVCVDSKFQNTKQTTYVLVQL